MWWSKLLQHLPYLRGLSCFSWIGHYNIHKKIICQNFLQWKESVGTLKMMDLFGASWKINWTDLLYIQRKAFGLSCRRYGITLVLNISENILTLYQRDVLLWLQQKVYKPNIKVKEVKNSKTYFIWYVLCSEQLPACFMNIMKLNHVLEVKNVNIFRPVRWSNNFGHHWIYLQRTRFGVFG